MHRTSNMGMDSSVLVLENWLIYSRAPDGGTGCLGPRGPAGVGADPRPCKSVLHSRSRRWKLGAGLICWVVWICGAFLGHLLTTTGQLTGNPDLL